MNIEQIESAKANFVQELADLEASLNALDTSNLDLYLTRSVELNDQIQGAKVALQALEALGKQALGQQQIEAETQAIEAERQRRQRIETELETQILQVLR